MRIEFDVPNGLSDGVYGSTSEVTATPDGGSVLTVTYNSRIDPKDCSNPITVGKANRQP